MLPLHKIIQTTNRLTIFKTFTGSYFLLKACRAVQVLSTLYVLYLSPLFSINPRPKTCKMRQTFQCPHSGSAVVVADVVVIIPSHDFTVLVGFGVFSAKYPNWQFVLYGCWDGC